MSAVSVAGAGDGGEISLGQLLSPLPRHWRLLLACPLVAGALGLGVTYLIPPTYSARATFLSPQSPGASSAALASLGSLAALAGGSSATRSSADQYAALMLSATVADRLIARFDLIKIYETKFKVDAHQQLSENTRVTIGKRDGLIAVEVDDQDPRRAADMANQYVEELRVLSGRLSLSEAQQRRTFFEGLMTKARDDLLKAQTALQGSGFTQGALRAEPRSAADAYARTRAQVSASEVKLEALRGVLTDGAPEVQRAQAELGALRAQLARIERADGSTSQSDYLVHYREFKYQETLFDLFARQYEAARVDEAREGLLIQVVDVAMPPEKKSRPRRGVIVIATTALAFLLLAGVIVLRERNRAAG